MREAARLRCCLLLPLQLTACALVLRSRPNAHAAHLLGQVAAIVSTESVTGADERVASDANIKFDGAIEVEAAVKAAEEVMGEVTPSVVETASGTPSLDTHDDSIHNRNSTVPQGSPFGLTCSAMHSSRAARIG